MTAAMAMFILGSFIEFTSYQNFIVLIVNLSVVLVKTIQTYQNFNGSGVALEDTWFFKYILPWELCFGLANCIKYT